MNSFLKSIGFSDVDLLALLRQSPGAVQVRNQAAFRKRSFFDTS